MREKLSQLLSSSLLVYSRRLAPVSNVEAEAFVRSVAPVLPVILLINVYISTEQKTWVIYENGL